MSVQHLKPFASIDEDERKEIFNEWRGKAAGNIQAQRDAVERDMERAFEQAGPDLDLEKIDTVGGSTLSEKCEGLVALHSKLSGLEDALAERTELDKVAKDIREGNRGGAHADAQPPQPVIVRNPEPPSLANMFFDDLQQRGITPEQMAESAAAGAHVGANLVLPARDIMNAVFKTSTGWEPFVERRPGYVPSAQREIQVVDIFPQFPTNQSAINYMEETAYTSAAKEKAEGTAAEESTLVLTERTDTVREITTEIPVTRVQLEDEAQVRAYLEDRLMFMMRQRVDGQILNGDGTAPNISGVLDRTGLQNQDWEHETDKTLSKPLTIMRKAKTQVSLTGRAMPSNYIINHATWDDCVTSESASGGYYLGNPQSDFGERIWGLPVVLSDHLDDDTAEDTVNAMVGDFRNFAALFVRRDFGIDVGFSGDDFSKRQIRIQGTVRVALSVYRPAAFCTISRPA